MAAKWPPTWWTKRLKISFFGWITNTSALARGPVRIINLIEIKLPTCSGKIMLWQYEILCLWCDELILTVLTLIKQKRFLHVINFFLFLKRPWKFNTVIHWHGFPFSFRLITGWIHLITVELFDTLIRMCVFSPF